MLKSRSSHSKEITPLWKSSQTMKAGLAAERRPLRARTSPAQAAVTACVCSASEGPWPLAHTPVIVVHLPSSPPDASFVSWNLWCHLPSWVRNTSSNRGCWDVPCLVNRPLTEESCSCLSLSPRFHDCSSFSNSNIVWIVIILLPFSGISYSSSPFKNAKTCNSPFPLRRG